MRTKHRARSIALCLVVGWNAGCAATPEPEIRLSEPGARAAFELTGLDPDLRAALAEASLDLAGWQRVFSVRVGEAPDADVPAMLGSYSIDDDAIRFVPRFALTPGVAYRARFDGTQLPPTLDPSRRPIVERVFSVEKPAAAPTEVVAVHPSADVLPANLLRFYVHFSAPMSRGTDYRHVRLVDADGREVPLAFLELPEELWDPSGRRLTLLFDPGRIKRGLLPRELEGPTLEAGRWYALVIDAAWPDARGEPLAAPFEKRFRASAPDMRQPDPSAWTLTPPRAGGRDPLVVEFREPLDRALVEHMLWVVGGDGRELDGEVTVTAGETSWSFVPGSAWEAGAHELVADTALEDRAGNSIGRPFDVDVFEAGSERVAVETVRLRFDVVGR